jgi:hypothetical protein
MESRTSAAVTPFSSKSDSTYPEMIRGRPVSLAYRSLPLCGFSLRHASIVSPDRPAIRSDITSGHEICIAFEDPDYL